MALVTQPPIIDAITIKEGVALLAPTGHPVTYDQLRHLLNNVGAPRERGGRGGDRYSATDVLELHRDYVDRQAG